MIVTARPEPPAPELLGPQLRAELLRLGRRLRVEREHSALSSNKIAILSHLARERESTPSRISAEERQQPQSLTRPLAELEADGLIVRTADAADARRSVLRLTDEGMAAFAADMRLRDRWLVEELRDADDDDLRVLADAVRVLARLGRPRG